MRSILGLGTLGLATILGLSNQAHAVLLETWDGTADGWTASQPAYSLSNSTTTGVTNGTGSLVATGTANPDYSALLSGPTSMATTTAIANATTVSVDVFTPGGTTGLGYLQFDLAINNATTGYTSVDGYTYTQAAVIGTETTITFTIPQAIRNTLATSAAPTGLTYQIGGGGATPPIAIYFDNLRTNLDSSTPEPASMLTLAGVGGLALIRRRGA